MVDRVFVAGLTAMMGKKTVTSKLFYRFNLEEYVPADHLLRQVAAAVDFAFVRRLTARFYSSTGQPSVDPIVLLKMALLGYLYGVTSERRLADEIRLHLAYRWFLGYDLDEATPDHSVLSKARARFGPTIYQAFFTEVVRQCEKAGLIRGDKLYIDSTLVEANASLASVGSRALVTQLPDVPTHVNQLWQENPIPPPTAEELERDGVIPLPCPSVSPPATTPSASGSPLGCALLVPPSDPRDAAAQTEHPPASSRVVSPEGSPDERTPSPDLHAASKADRPNGPIGTVNDSVVSRTDPDAELVQRPGVPLDLYYKVHVGVDGGKARIITAVEATGGAMPDQDLLERVIQEHQGNVGRQIGEAVADSQYGTIANYELLTHLQIAPSIPRHETGADRLALPAEVFVYDPQTDSYQCPQGKPVRRRGAMHAERVTGGVLYQADPADCAACPLKARCCPKGKARTIFRANTDPLRQRVAIYLQTFQARQSIRRRKVWVETIFGDTKVRRGLRRAQFRGRDRMRIQAWLTAIAHNVRKLALFRVVGPATGTGVAVQEQAKGEAGSLLRLLCCHLLVLLPPSYSLA